MHPLVLRDEEPADAAGPVGACDHLALDLALGPVRVDEPDQRRVPFHASDFGVPHPEADVAAVPVSRVGEIDEDVCLRVQPAGRIDKRSEVDAVPSSVKAQFDAVVLVPVGVHPVADAGIDDRLYHAVLEDAGPVRCLDLLSRSGVDGHVACIRLWASRWESIRPAGPAPTIPTRVLIV